MKKCGKPLTLVYVLIIISVIPLQLLWFGMTKCNVLAPIEYYWIGAVVILFYIMAALELSLLGEFVGWTVEEEEEIIQKAIKQYLIEK